MTESEEMTAFLHFPFFASLLPLCVVQPPKSEVIVKSIERRYLVLRKEHKHAQNAERRTQCAEHQQDEVLAPPFIYLLE